MSSQQKREGDQTSANGLDGADSAALDRHLETENPATNSLEVARGWDDIYRELIEAEEELLGRLRETLPRLSEGARREAELTDLPMIVQYLQMFKYRRGFWHQRVLELTGR